MNSKIASDKFSSENRTLFKAIYNGRPLIHRFFDSSPMSRDDKFIALTEFQNDEETPIFGQHACMCIFDVSTGDKIFSYDTFAWDSQVGCHAQWGYDNKVYFNDFDRVTNSVVACAYDPYKKSLKKYDESIYIVCRNSPFAFTPYIPHLIAIQLGYGIRQPINEVQKPLSRGASRSIGVTRLSLVDGESALEFSISDVVSFCSIHNYIGDVESFYFFIFHTKLSPCETKLLFILRAKSQLHDKFSKNFLIEYNLVSKVFNVVVNCNNWGSGHHPNYFFDDARVVMNLPSRNHTLFDKILMKVDKALTKFTGFSGSRRYKLRFAIINSERQFNFVPQAIGSGHPIVLPGSNYIITDCYPYEPVAISPNEVPIRLIDIRNGAERVLFTLDTCPSVYGKFREWRIDPHPAISASAKFIVLNAKLNNVRSVLIYSLEGLVE